jgi:DMSO/TMAO reductase YedYZ molybdopterin-dependent catalytic subunit
MTAAPPPRPDVGVFTSPIRDERTAAVLGIALGVGFVVCFVTGVLSHLIQEPPSWFVWPSRPAGLYRLTQGVHVVLGLALLPILLAKIWVTYPHLFTWPPVRGMAHGLERLALLPLLGGGLFLIVTGLGNINIWRPWEFGFRTGHFWAAWLTMGALGVHLAAKWATTRTAITEPAALGVETGARPDHGLDRRGFLATVFATAGAITLFSAGQTVEPLRRLALLVPRRPDVGPQGFPVNRTAAAVGLTEVDTDAYRLVVAGPGVGTELELSLADLGRMEQREAELPIACVEGWSASRRWRGVPVRDLLERAGASEDAEVTVVSMQESRRLRSSELNRRHARDPDTLLALQVNGEDLAPDHGFPLRLIGPNRPGVMQTKWVGRLEVR